MFPPTPALTHGRSPRSVRYVLPHGLPAANGRHRLRPEVLTRTAITGGTSTATTGFSPSFIGETLGRGIESTMANLGNNSALDVMAYPSLSPMPSASVDSYPQQHSYSISPILLPFAVLATSNPPHPAIHSTLDNRPGLKNFEDSLGQYPVSASETQSSSPSTPAEVGHNMQRGSNIPVAPKSDRSCEHCGADKSVCKRHWRPGPGGQATLCNACGHQLERWCHRDSEEFNTGNTKTDRLIEALVSRYGEDGFRQYREERRMKKRTKSRHQSRASSASVSVTEDAAQVSSAVFDSNNQDYLATSTDNFLHIPPMPLQYTDPAWTSNQ